MRLDMMECDLAIKTQSKVELNSIYFFIQGAIAAANNCAIIDANKLYRQADRLLSNFMKNDCGCSGINYVNNFRQKKVWLVVEIVALILDVDAN